MGSREFCPGELAGAREDIFLRVPGVSEVPDSLIRWDWRGLGSPGLEAFGTGGWRIRSGDGQRVSILSLSVDRDQRK